MKKLIIFMFSIVMLGSCVTISRYSGEIYPANVTLERPNFKYIKTVTGISDATFSGYGWDVKKANGIVNEAKQNLYQKLQLKENQAPTNFTLDFVRVGQPNGEYLVLRQLKAVLTADIFEFSDNGIFSDNDSKKILNNTIQNNNQEEKLKLDNVAVVKVGFTDYSEGFKLKKGTIVLFNAAGKYYKAVVNFKDYGKTNMKDIQVYDFETNNWIPSERENVTVPNTTIIGYKL